jgi:uncharacterized protein (TIGR03067 family)
MNTLCAVSITTLLLALGGDITEIIKKDRAALQGTWQVVASEDNGEKVPADDLKGLFLIFKGDAIAIREGGKAEERFSFLLDPTKKPKEIDLTIKVGPKKGQTDRAIYHLDGDLLRICIQSNNDAPRPREFVSKAGSKLWLVVLQKTKEK